MHLMQTLAHTTNYRCREGKAWPEKLKQSGFLYSRLADPPLRRSWNWSKDLEGGRTRQIYGLFLCRGDIKPDIYKSCINTASAEIGNQCPGNKEAIIWDDQCLVRYSYRSFFSIMELSPVLYAWNLQDVNHWDEFAEIRGSNKDDFECF